MVLIGRPQDFRMYMRESVSGENFSRKRWIFVGSFQNFVLVGFIFGLVSLVNLFLHTLGAEVIFF